MRLLLVEDRPDTASQIERALRSIGDCDVTWVASRDAALAALEADYFDLILLDRRIPSADGVLDDHQDHGWRVFQHIREHFAGTPVWFLTATVDGEFAAEFNNDYGRNEDLHGANVREQMYRVFWKKQLQDCVRKVGEFVANRTALDRIPIRSDIQDLTLIEKRILRHFARSFDGSEIRCTKLGGLSGARVVKVNVLAADNTPRVTAVAKIATLEKIKDEAERYRIDISRLGVGAAPQLTKRIEVGAGNFGGIFYQMVGETVRSVFQLIAEADDRIPDVPATVRGYQRIWYQAKRVEQVSIAQIRRSFISDTQIRDLRPELEGFDIAAIERRRIQATICRQHGDMHCANVVFDDRGLPLMIDFGDVGQHFAAADPVTFELSAIFHPDSAILSPEWPNPEGLSHWTNVAEYSAGCTFAPFILSCRAWAMGEAASLDEVVATAYGYAMRQLKYKNQRSPLAKILIRACCSHFGV